MGLRRGIACLTLVAGALALAGCGSKQDALRPESGPAHGIATLWWIMLAASGVGLTVVVAILAGSWLRRDRVGGDRPALAVVLGLGIATPILVLAALFLYSDIFLIRGTAPPAANAAGALSVRVIGHQFWWEIRYPGTNAITANELHIPVRTHVVVYVHSDDVVHSFWVPQLNRKIDLEPDQVNRVVLYADKVGRYRGQCAEYCGLQHAHMGLYVFADPPGAYRRWLRREAQRASNPSPLFEQKCGSCHTVRGTGANGTAGPDLTHVAGRQSLGALVLKNTPEHMRDWIRAPQRWKPGVQMPAVDLSDAQVRRLATYLEGLK